MRPRKVARCTRSFALGVTKAVECVIGLLVSRVEDQNFVRINDLRVVVPLLLLDDDAEWDTDFVQCFDCEP